LRFANFSGPADENTSNGFEERIYVLHDTNYNVTAIVDTSGDVLERYYYEAYGRAVYLDDAFALLPDGQSDHGWQHLHQGGRLDTIAGNYHFRHRDLSHSLGRWISQDPIGFEAGDANLYRYVGNGPGNNTDPTGLEEWPLWHPNRYLVVVRDYLFGHYGDAYTNDVEGNKNRLRNTEFLGEGRLTAGGNLNVSEGTTAAMEELATLSVEWMAAGGSFVGPGGLAPINQQKQAGHIPGSPQHVNRCKQGKPTSTFHGERSGEMATRIANQRGTPVPGRPNVKEYDFGVGVGTGPNGGTQTRVRVHTSPKTGQIHGHPSGPERF